MIALLKLLLAYLLAFFGTGLAVVVLYAPAREYLRKKFQSTTDTLVDLYIWMPSRRLWVSFCVSPFLCGWITWSITHSLAITAGVAVAGIIIPEQAIQFLKYQRLTKFNSQLVDALLSLSSSLKAGLSMPQAFEVLVEEMPTPMSQEFGLVVKETKMGLMMNESLLRLKQRVNSDDLALIVTALLVARETGGDVTQVFSQLIQTIRDRQKVKEKLKTLTLQSKLQGAVLSALPVGFAFFAQSMNPGYFNIFLHTPTGRILLMLAVSGEVIGVFLIWRFGRMPL